MRLSPSEYFARQCWVSYEIDEQTLPALAPFIGEQRIVWGSDYPHHDATFPGALDALRRTLAPLDPAVQAMVLGSNAADLYRLPAYRTAIPGDEAHQPARQRARHDAPQDARHEARHEAEQGASGPTVR
jgi:hypothetical protein